MPSTSGMGLFEIVLPGALEAQQTARKMPGIARGSGAAARVLESEDFDMTRKRLLAASLVMASMWAGGTLASNSFAQKESVPKQPNKVVIAREKVKELLLLMDTGKNGKISKEEWMKFVETEFDKLDTMKKGEIDPKELSRSVVSVGHVRTSDLGK